MNITNIPRLVRFDDIEQGQCFLFYGHVFLKIRPIAYDTREEKGVVYNAVNLENGNVTTFYLSEEFIVLDADINIRGIRGYDKD